MTAVTVIIGGLLGIPIGAAPAQLPFTEDFESGALAPYWTVNGTGQYRIQVTNTYQPHGGSYHLLMDDRTSDTIYSRNQLTLRIDLSGYTNVLVQFWIKGFNEDPQGPPLSPFTSADFDGIAISTTGHLWQEVQTWRNLSNDYVHMSAPLDGAVRAAGWAYTTNVLIRFYQYDNQSIPGDGIALDDIAITGNRPPTAESRTIAVQEDSRTVLELPGSDPEGGALVGTILSLPASGELFQITNGAAGDPITNVPTPLIGGQSVIYAASPNRSGTNVASFEFRLSDGTAWSENAVLTIDISPVNDPPSAEPDIVSTLSGRAVTFNPLANDWDRDGDTVQLARFFKPSRGSVVENADGGAVYTPDPDFRLGSDQFQYVIADPSGLLATGTVSVLVGHLQGGDWSTFANGPSHTGYYPGRMENERFLPTWSIPYSNSATLGINEVVIGEGLAIFTEVYRATSDQFSNHIIAVDLDNGREKWSGPLPMAYFYPPTYDRGRIFIVQDTPHVLWCVSARTGELIWTNRLSSTPSANFAPTVAADGIWFRTGAGRMLAGFDTNGTFRFETFVGGYSWDPYWTASYYQDVVYCWDLAALKALHPQTGELLWQIGVNQYPPSFVSVAPAVAEGRAFLNARERFAAVDLAARTLAWTNAGEYIGTPAVHKGVVYITSTNRVQAFRTSDGVLVREYGPVADEMFIYTSQSLCPIVTDDVLISSFTSNTYVFNLETTALLQTLPYSGGVALANGTLLLSSTDAKLRAFALQVSNDLLLTAEATNKATIWNPVTQIFTVRNPGPAQATAVQLVYHIPGNSSFGSAVASQGSCQRSGDEVICNLGTITGDAQARVSFNVVPASLGWFAAEATVTRAEPDVNPDNNVASASTEIELPVLSVAGFSVPEGNSGTTRASVLLSLSATSSLPVSLIYELSGYSAISGVDFLSSTGMVVFPPGAKEQTVSVSIIGDTEFELDEQIYFGVWNVTNALNSSFLTVLTILNDDPAPVIWIDSISVTEGNVGQTDAVFTLSLSKTSSLPVSVFLQTSNITAQGGVDYGTNSLWMGFSPGTRTLSFAVPIYGDVAIESNETFAVLLSSPQNATLGNSFGLGTIINDDGLPGRLDHFSFGTLSAPIYARHPFPTTLTALDAQNRVASSFNARATLQTLLEQPSVVVAAATNEFSPLPFAPLQDNAAGYLHSEFIYLASELQGPRRLTALEFQSPVSLLPNNLTIRIQHTPRSSFDSLAWTASGWTSVFVTNDMWRSPAVIQFQAPFDYNGTDNLLIEFDWKADFNWASARPGSDTKQLRALFWYSRYSYAGIPVGAPSATSILPSIRFHGAAANAVTPPDVQFVNGVWSGNLTVSEPLANLALRLDDGGGHVTVTPPLTMELLDDLSLQISHPEMISPNTPFEFTLTISNTGPAVSTGVVVSNIVSSNLQILSAVSSRGSCVQSGGGAISCSLGDLPAASTETIRVEVTALNPSPVSIQSSVGRVEPEYYLPNNAVNATIAQPSRITITDSWAAEGSSFGYQYMYFTVMLWPPPIYTVSVAYYTEDISAGSEQNDLNKDYYAEYGVITFNPGETNKTFSIELRPDLTAESDETFRVRLVQPINGVIQQATAIGTILNDDLAMRISLNLSLGVVRLEFQVQSNKSYSVQFADSLNRPVWQTLADIAPDVVSHSVIIIDPHVTSARFYRVRTPSQRY